MHSEALPERRLARPGDRLETADKVDITAGRDFEGEPGELRGGDVDAGVEGQETGFGIGVVREFGLEVASAE
jgi:hypothetical protein